MLSAGMLTNCYGAILFFRLMPNKYRAKKTEVDGIKFDSKREAERYGELKLLEKAGQISRLKPHPRFLLAGNGVQIKLRSERYPNGRQAVYTADFEYMDNQTFEMVIEDVKGMATKAAKLRIAVFESLTGRRVRIVK